MMVANTKTILYKYIKDELDRLLFHLVFVRLYWWLSFMEYHKYII